MDGISTELLIKDGPTLIEFFQVIITKVLTEGRITSEWSKSRMISILARSIPHDSKRANEHKTK